MCSGTAPSLPLREKQSGPCGFSELPGRGTLDLSSTCIHRAVLLAHWPLKSILYHVPLLLKPCPKPGLPIVNLSVVALLPLTS